MKAKKLLAAVLAVAFVVGCTKARKAKFGDEETAGAMYAVSELQNVKVQATTEEAAQVSAQELETNRVKIAKTNASARVNALLVGLEITGKPATQYNLFLTVASDAVTVYKVVEQEKELSAIERQSAYRNKGEFFAPIAQIKVKAYGVIERSKNANGERTSTLVLKSTPFGQASHVNIDTNLDNVMKVDNEYANLVRIHDIKGKEFLFRRTFAKASSTFIVAPGRSGDMEIVKINLKKDRISVRKVLHLKGAKTNDSSKEEIMSVEAKYFKRTGSGSVPNKLVETNVEQAEYVQINWNTEKSSYVSPLDNVKNACFADQTTMIDALDNRMDEGVLSFSKVTTATVKEDCGTGNLVQGGYAHWEQQRNFEFSERVSFRVFDQTQMASPTADIPYEVQKILGFGVFTTARKTPNKFGNTTMIGQERALPSLFDFSNGKVVRFVLGGLDDMSGHDEDIRQVIIDASKEVIADWNNTLKYSFHGSNLQREGAYVQLLIEGVDIKKGELGDLDRNYIWNYMDAFDSGIAGLSQAAPNPLTGRVEQTNVLMYPGSTIALIGLLKERHKVIQDYEKFKLASAQKGEKTSSGPLPAGCGDNCSNVSEADIEEYQHNMGFAKNSQLSLRSGKTLSAAKVQSSQRSSNAISAASRKNAMAKITSEMFLSRIMQRATQERATSNAVRMSIITAEEILKAAKSGELGQISEKGLKVIEFETKADALKLAFKEELKNVNGCLMERNELSSGSGAFIEQDPKIILKNMYKWTLAHELGHSFGLTHNFKGSFDQANFKFTKDEKVNREYSTVMDYSDDSKVMYAGLGPYDAHVIRAAYTGRIETADGKIVNLEDIRKALKLDSWWKFDGNKFNQAALKKYEYCNDFDLGGDPACAQHDRGTTYSALVDEKIQNFKSAYPWSYNRGNRIDPLDETYSYVQRLRKSMTSIRTFSDELVYNVITTRDRIPDMLCAYRKSKNFFMEVIGTPTTNLAFDNPGRFSFAEFEAPKLDASGCSPVADEKGEMIIEKKKVVVEAKNLENRVSTYMNGINQRGTAIEKVFAMLMLTQRGLGVERYATRSIEASIADVEAMFFQGKDVESNSILMLLNSQLTGQPTPLFADGILLTDLSAPFEVEQNSLTRSYALLASGSMLDTDSSQSASNLSTHFRVGSTKQIPVGKTIVALKDQKFDNGDLMKFYALNGASAAQKLVDMAAARRILMENSEAIGTIINEGVAAIKAKDEEATSKAVEKLAEKIAELNKENLIIPARLKENGLGEKELAGFVFEKSAQLAGLLDNVAPQIKTEEQLMQVLAGGAQLSASNKELMMGPVPILGLINGAFSSLYPEPESVNESDKEAMAKEFERQVRVALINTAMPPNVIESQHDLLVLNLTQLNEMFNTLHPELNKN